MLAPCHSGYPAHSGREDASTQKLGDKSALGVFKLYELSVPCHLHEF